MKRVLENDFLKVTIDDHGAELVSIYDKEKDREVIWQGDPRFWGRHAPVLFPNVGKHYGNHYRIGDREYASKQHGFAVTQISHVLVHTGFRNPPGSFYRRDQRGLSFWFCAPAFVIF